MLLILGKRSIKGWSAGTPADSEDTVRLAGTVGIRPMIEKYPLEKARDGYARMMSGDAPYRAVLTMKYMRCLLVVRSRETTLVVHRGKSTSLSRTSETEFVDSESLDLGFQRLARKPKLRSGAFGAADSASGL